MTTPNLPANVNVRHDDAALPPKRHAKTLNTFQIDAGAQILMGEGDTMDELCMSSKYILVFDGEVNLEDAR